jgi:hypothetical protein
MFSDNTDVRVVEESQDYVILAVRLAKDVHHAPLPAKKLPTHIRALLGGCVGVGLLVAGALWAGEKVAFALHGPPIEYKSVRLLTPKVAPNGDLMMETIARRTRVCDFSFTHLIEKLPDHLSVYRIRKYGIGQAISDDYITRKVAVQLPDGLKPGLYSLITDVRADCEHGDVFTLEHKPLEFAVVAGG